MTWRRKLAGAMVIAALLPGPSRLPAQIKMKLGQDTISDFDRYANGVETELTERWQGRRSFLSIDDRSQDREAAHHGEFVIRESAKNGEIAVREGLASDWTGTVFIPNVSVAKVQQALSDFDHHKDFFQDVVESKLMSRNGDMIRGHWRLRRKGVAVVVLDVEQDVQYFGAGEGKRYCRAYARKISEVEHAGEKTEHALPPGEGYGLLWRLYAYWSLEQSPDGVYAECRSLSLSRDIPAAMAWMIKPMLQGVPHKSMTATLEGARNAATHLAAGS